MLVAGPLDLEVDRGALSIAVGTGDARVPYRPLDTVVIVSLPGASGASFRSPPGPAPITWHPSRSVGDPSSSRRALPIPLGPLKDHLNVFRRLLPVQQYDFHPLINDPAHRRERAGAAGRGSLRAEV